MHFLGIIFVHLNSQVLWNETWLEIKSLCHFKGETSPFLAIHGTQNVKNRLILIATRSMVTSTPA